MRQHFLLSILITLSSFSFQAIGQEVLFESSDQIVYYSINGNKVDITVEDSKDLTLNSGVNADSSLIDFIVLQFDQDQDGIITNGTDIYYTHNSGTTNGACSGDITSTSSIGSCTNTTAASASVILDKSIQSNFNHVIYNFSIPQSELFDGTNVCSRLSIKLHRAGDTKTSFINIPSSPSTVYFVTPYLTLPLFEKPNFGKDYNACTGDTLSTTTLYPNYSWTDNGATSYQLISDSGEYHLTVKDATCSLSDTVIINTMSTSFCSSLDLTFPTVVTPNNDGTNDYFEPLPGLLHNTIDFSEAELSIYNRWGMQVGGKKGAAPFWDCHLDFGQKVQAGTYFYSYRPTAGKTGIINGYFTVLYSL